MEEEGGGGQKIKGMRRRKNRRRKQEKREERIFKERKQKGETWRDGCEEGKRTDSRRRRRRCREGGREGGALVWPSVLNTSIPLPPPLPCRLPSRTGGRNYVRRDRTSPPRRRPRPMRYVTGPSPAISNCCHHLFIFPFPSRFNPPLTLLPTATAGPGLINISQSEPGRGLSVLIVLGLATPVQHHNASL